MKALVFYGRGDIRYEPDWPEPLSPGPGMVKVAISWCGICGTDIEDYRKGGMIPVDTPHPLTGRMAPLVIGHEFSGRIAEVGAGVENVTVGQKVAIECVVGCGQCYWCQRHEIAQCVNMVSIGQMEDGGFAECCLAPAVNCIPVPDDTPEDALALCEPFAVMLRATAKGRVKVGDVVAIVGAGAIGLCGVAASQIAGASKIIVIAHGGHRAVAAKEVGATHVLNSHDADWRDEYLSITGGMMADVVFDTGGNIPAMKLAFDITKRGGCTVFVSVINEDIPLPAFDIMRHEKEIVGSIAHSHEKEFKWAVDYVVQRRVNLAPIITGRTYIADSFEQGIVRFMEDRNQIKILVTPHRDWVK